MNKQMKLITTAGILGLFLVANYAFELLGKIGAAILSAVLTGQLPAEAWNSQLYATIGQQSFPFLIMIVIGALSLQWARGKNKALAAADSQWADGQGQRKETNLAVVGGLLLFAGFYNLFVPIFFGYADLIAGLSSPDSAGYVLKAILPNYVVLLVQMAVGIWLVLGTKAAVIPAVEALLPNEADGEVETVDVAEGTAGENTEGPEADEESAPVAEMAAVDEEVNKVQ